MVLLKEDTIDTGIHQQDNQKGTMLFMVLQSKITIKRQDINPVFLLLKIYDSHKTNRL